MQADMDFSPCIKKFHQHFVIRNTVDYDLAC